MIDCIIELKLFSKRFHWLPLLTDEDLFFETEQNRPNRFILFKLTTEPAKRQNDNRSPGLWGGACWSVVLIEYIGTFKSRLLATDRSKAVVLVYFLLNVFGEGVSCRNLYSFVVYLYLERLILLQVYM